MAYWLHRCGSNYGPGPFASKEEVQTYIDSRKSWLEKWIRKYKAQKSRQIVLDQEHYVLLEEIETLAGWTMRMK